MEEALIKKVQPHSKEAEQAVIGSMIMDKDALLTASELLQGEDFYIQQYGILFDAMVELLHEGKPAELVTILDKLFLSLRSCPKDFKRFAEVPPRLSYNGVPSLFPLRLFSI